MTLKKYIQEKKRDSFTVKGVKVFLKDAPVYETDYRKAVTFALSKIPAHLLSNITSIHIGVFEILITREVQAVYEGGKIFLTNSHESVYDALDDIIHEVAHSVEEVYAKEIYEDNTIKREFLEKRKKMWQRLKDRGFEKELSFFIEMKYNKEFDKFLYKEVGYPVLRMITSDVFYSPYAATSLREYFANSFEAFFMREEVQRLKKISPAAFEKNVILLNMEE